MKLLRFVFDKLEPLFNEGGKLAKIKPLYEALDTFAFTPGYTTKGAPHVRDAIDLKRLMITVFIALVPCCLMACYNTGLQANWGLEEIGQDPAGWRAALLSAIGVGFSPKNPLACFLHGLLYFLPVGNFPADAENLQRHTIIFNKFRPNFNPVCISIFVDHL